MIILIKNTFLSITLIFLVVISNTINAQQFQRIKADYSIKYKDPQGNEILRMGVVFYDINSKAIVMKNGFPTREILIQKDTSIYQVINEKLVGSGKSYTQVELSIYHLALTGDLSNFGIDKAGYTLDTIKSDKGLLLTTWIPPKNLSKILGKILVSTKEKQLFGIVFLDASGNIIAKHLFRDYTNINGFEFPKEVLVITYANGEEVFHLTKYSKIVVNDTNNNEYYNYKIPTN